MHIPRYENNDLYKSILSAQSLFENEFLFIVLTDWRNLSYDRLAEFENSEL